MKQKNLRIYLANGLAVVCKIAKRMAFTNFYVRHKIKAQTDNAIQVNESRKW